MARSVIAASWWWARGGPRPRAPVALLAAGLLGCGASQGALSGGAGGASSTGGGGQGTGGGLTLPPLTATAIAVGAAHTCALVGGAVACWGDGSLGQLGDGASGDHHVATPAFVPGLSGATAIRAGGNTTCALLQGGAVSCWGDGTFGQLGDGKAAPGHFASSPVQVEGAPGAPLLSVTDLTTSGTNTCAAVGPAGTAWCWGLNAAEQWLGFASSDCGPYPMTDATGMQTLTDEPCEPAPRQVPSVLKATLIADGGEHVCARVEKDDLVRCWGADNFGQLGDGVFGPDAHDPVPTLVDGLSGVGRLALGASHSCALFTGGQGIVCWGDNSYGQLGIDDASLDSYQTKPTQVPGLAGALDLDAAAETTCAVLADGSVRCWGDVSNVLPTPVAPNQPSPEPVNGVDMAVGVRTGGGHACALRADDTVVCWGRNDLGQLGNGTVGPSDFTMVAVEAPEGGPG